MFGNIHAIIAACSGLIILLPKRLMTQSLLDLGQTVRLQLMLQVANTSVALYMLCQPDPACLCVANSPFAPISIPLANEALLSYQGDLHFPTRLPVKSLLRILKPTSMLHRLVVGSQRVLLQGRIRDDSCLDSLSFIYTSPLGRFWFDFISCTCFRSINKMIVNSIPGCRCGYCVHGPLNRAHCLACIKRKAARARGISRQSSAFSTLRAQREPFPSGQASKTAGSETVKDIHSFFSQDLDKIGPPSSSDMDAQSDHLQNRPSGQGPSDYSRVRHNKRVVTSHTDQKQCNPRNGNSTTPAPCIKRPEPMIMRGWKMDD